MKTEDLPYTPADLEQATRLVDSPRFKEFLGPIRNFVVGKASDLKDQGDESVRVYRIASPEL